MIRYSEKNPGFTLIELLITIVISGLLIGIGAVKYRDFTDVQIAKGAAATMRNDLRNIQGSASSGLKPGSCGNNTLDGYQVSYFSQNSYTSQAYCNSVPIDTPKTYKLPANIIFPRPFSDILFKPIAEGATSVNIFLQNQKDGKCYWIYISASGNITDNGEATCPTTSGVIIVNSGTSSGISCQQLCTQAPNYFLGAVSIGTDTAASNGKYISGRNSSNGRCYSGSGNLNTNIRNVSNNSCYNTATASTIPSYQWTRCKCIL